MTEQTKQDLKVGMLAFILGMGLGILALVVETLSII